MNVYKLIIFYKEFRGLSDKIKMIYTENCVHFKNKLSHSLEVATIACDMASRINEKFDLNIDLEYMRYLSYSHDLGHAPFEHSGEQTLHELLNITKYGFKHNVFPIKLLESNNCRINDVILKHLSINYNNETIYNDYQIENKITHIIYDANKYLPQKINNQVYLKIKYALTIEGQILEIADEISQRISHYDDAIRILLCKNKDISINKNKYVKESNEICNKKFNKNDKINRFLEEYTNVFTYKIAKQDFSNTLGKDTYDFYVDTLGSNLKLSNCINNIVDKRIIKFSSDIEKIINYFHNISYNIFFNFGFMKSQNEMKKKNKSLFKYYNNLSKLDRFVGEKINHLCSQNKRKIDNIKDSNGEVKLIIVESIAKMTNNYLDNKLKEFNI